MNKNQEILEELEEWEKKAINDYEQQLIFIEQQIDYEEGLLW